MKEKSIVLIFLIIFAIASIVSAWSHFSIFPEMNLLEDNPSNPALNRNTTYCYHMTWMGPNFNNRTFKNIRNKTCTQYFKDKKTLCINPMVATFSGGDPDFDYVLEHHPLEATCRLSSEQVCVKYTMYKNGRISYQTRYCSIVNVVTEGTLKKGCLVEKRGNDLIEVCACRSEPGPKGICNKGATMPQTKALLSLIFFYGTHWLFIK